MSKMIGERIRASVVLGGLAGLALGFAEAARLYFTPRTRWFIAADSGPAIWFIAPLVGEAVFVLVGLVLGLSAAWGEDRGRLRRTTLLALGAGLAAIYLFLVVRPTHIWFEEPVELDDLTTSMEWFAVTFVLSGAAIWHHNRQKVASPLETSAIPRRWVRLVAIVTLVELAGLGIFTLRRAGPFVSKASASPLPSEAKPNIVFIVLDTTRADHLSPYGYSRATTPNLQRLAEKGVVFENAISPGSWTIPSFGSYFTGLLPHQHGAGVTSAIRSELTTVAEVLNSRGYETAGFNANSGYGLAIWGLSQGFETYQDDSSSLERNLIHTFLGRNALEELYEASVTPNYFGRRVGAKLNNEVMRWYAHRSQRPFFLFVNFFDAHTPYVPPAPYDKRFPVAPGSSDDVTGARGAIAVTPSRLRSNPSLIIATYDNCLAYLDDQMGKLTDVLMQSPEWPNTILIITADHGEGFSEHGTYIHGVNLYREVTHVPLIILGKGVPANRRVTNIARTREVFFTILDFVSGEKSPFESHSLRRHWEPGYQPTASDSMAISEIDDMISLTTPEWHFILSDVGHSELYRWVTDQKEQHDLAQVSEYKPTAQALYDALLERVKASTQPWYGTNYLPIHKPAGGTSMRQASTQAPSRFRKVLSPDDDELLRGLPYH